MKKINLQSVIKFTTISLMLTLVSAPFWCNFARADGGVSDGGGGTTNPNPADPYWIVRSAWDDAAPAILAWLNNEEAHFGRLSDEEKLKYPLNKVFTSGKDFRKIVRTTPVELKMSAPCLNRDGEARDGSIYSSKPGAICISPYSIAPKVTEFNQAAETIALIVHEFAHLVGADEQEASAIQKHALISFARVDFLDFKVEVSLMSKGEGELGHVFSEYRWIKYAANHLKQHLVDAYETALVRFRDSIQLKYPFLSYLSEHQLLLLQAQFTRTGTVKDYACANDPAEDSELRKYCLDNLDKVFQNDSEISAATYWLRDGGYSYPEKEFSEVLIKRPSTPEGAMAVIDQTMIFIKEIQATFKDLDTTELQCYKN